MNRKQIGLIIIIGFCAVTFYMLFSSKEIAAFPELIKQIQLEFLYIAIALMLVYIFFNTMIIYVIGREVSESISIKRALYISFVGQYYSLVTPFASGGQPAQIYTMKSKYGISVPRATTLTVKKFIIYQVVVSVYAVVMFFVKIDFIFMKYPKIIVFIIIGLLVNFLGGILIILLSYSEALVRTLLELVIRIATKIKLAKFINKKNIMGHIDEYVETIDDIKNNKRTMGILIVLTFIQLTIYFSITYFIYLSLGQQGASYFDILAIQTIVYVVVSFIPTPGGAGASEGSFYVLFKSFFSIDVLLYAMTLWRLIIYYGILILSGLVILAEKILQSFRKIEV